MCIFLKKKSVQMIDLSQNTPEHHMTPLEMNQSPGVLGRGSISKPVPPSCVYMRLNSRVYSLDSGAVCW